MPQSFQIFLISNAAECTKILLSIDLDSNFSFASYRLEEVGKLNSALRVTLSFSFLICKTGEDPLHKTAVRIKQNNICEALNSIWRTAQKGINGSDNPSDLTVLLKT